jgi:long-chain acyl-CoA synthetase
MEPTPQLETFCQSLIAAAGSRPDKVAMMVIEPEGTDTITFGSMLAQVRSIAYRLSQEKIAFGDRVALIGENHPNWAIAYLGIIYRGAVVTPMDPGATTQTLAAFLKGSEAKLAFVSPDSLDKFRAACEQIGSNIRAVALRPFAHANGLARFEEWAQTPTPQEFIDAPPPAKPEDLAILIYTSGTTGLPKAVPLSHGNIYAESTKVQEVMRISEREVILSLLPLFHA